MSVVRMHYHLLSHHRQQSIYIQGRNGELSMMPVHIVLLLYLREGLRQRLVVLNVLIMDGLSVGMMVSVPSKSKSTLFALSLLHP